MSEFRNGQPGFAPLPTFTTDETGTIRHEFYAWLADEVLGPKLDGFIASQRAKVLTISRQKVRVRIGTRRWASWSGKSYDAPLEVTITFGNPAANSESLVAVVAELRPLAGATDKDAFEKRALDVLRALRGCLMAHDVQSCTADFDYTPTPLL